MPDAILDLVVSMLVELPSVGGLAFGMWTLYLTTDRILDTLDETIRCGCVNVDFPDERSGTSPEGKSELTQPTKNT